jgi:hypothetical protein
LAIGLAAGLDYWAPEKTWRWGLALMLAQAVVLVIVGSDYSLLPLGVIVCSILALPAIGLAQNSCDAPCHRSQVVVVADGSGRGKSDRR